MEIELSEDLQHYKESLVLGLTAKQFLFSALALGVGTGIVLLLYEKIGITLSCYVATPFVVPLALTGFYNYHGLTFWQFAGKMIYFSFFNPPFGVWLYGIGAGIETDLYGNLSGRRTGSTAKEKGTEKREERW